MFIYGVQPSQELWEKKPEKLSVASAGAAWQAGFGDGANTTTHAIFEDEVTPTGVQMFYDEGYERGEQERKVADQINNRHGDESEEPEAESEPDSEEASPTPGIEIHIETDEDTLIRDSALVLSAVSLAAIAAALWLGNPRSGLAG